MLLVAGGQRTVVSALTEALSSRGREYCWVEPNDSLFERMFELKGRGVVVLEDRPDDALLRAALSGMEAPGANTFVLVTSRGDDDPGLREVKRRGVPYVVLRAGRVIELDDLDAVRGDRVFVSREVVAATESAVTPQGLAREVLRALDDDDLVGRVVEVRPTEPEVLALLRAVGAAPEVVSRLRARAASLLGRACVLLANDGAPLVVPPSRLAFARRAA